MKTTNLNSGYQKLEYEFFQRMNSMNEGDRDFVNRALIKAMKTKLTSKQLTYCIRYYVYGIQMKDIAEEFGINKSTVSRTIKRARRRLYDILKFTSPDILCRVMAEDYGKVVKRKVATRGPKFNPEIRKFYMDRFTKLT